MAEKSTDKTQSSAVAVDPQAALNAVHAENEWRKNRMLLLENEMVRLRRRLDELEGEAAKPPAKDKEAK